MNQFFLQTISTQSNYLGYFLTKTISLVLTATKYKPFISLTADELVFGYDDTLVSLAHRFYPRNRRPMSQMGLLNGVSGPIWNSPCQCHLKLLKRANHLLFAACLVALCSRHFPFLLSEFKDRNLGVNFLITALPRLNSDLTLRSQNRYLGLPSLLHHDHHSSCAGGIILRFCFVDVRPYAGLDCL